MNNMDLTYRVAHRFSVAAGSDEPIPTYKGKKLKALGSYAGPTPENPYGENTWVLEGKGVLVTAVYRYGGWDVKLEMDGWHSPPGSTHGRDLETVIDSMVKNMKDAMKGARKRIDNAEKAIDSLS
jgi:hypothetical protein